MQGGSLRPLPGVGAEPLVRAPPVGAVRTLTEGSTKRSAAVLLKRIRPFDRTFKAQKQRTREAKGGQVQRVQRLKAIQGATFWNDDKNQCFEIRMPEKRESMRVPFWRVEQVTARQVSISLQLPQPTSSKQGTFFSCCTSTANSNKQRYIRTDSGTSQVNYKNIKPKQTQTATLMLH
ncbi:uncharacterized protein [Melanerpes formicivorus]|uniref:uncharacterized protein isoform X3 n=1 Tax=Melanerpes formicivorus TaxID=211600 RepID=UPI00358E0E3F